MKCLLLAAGLGTRLRPFTEHTPKCLVEIQGVPLLEHWLSGLYNAGVREFLINTHHLADQVRDFVENHTLRRFITLVHEDELLGTGGTLLANRPFMEAGTTLLAHADNLCICDWNAFIAGHSNRPASCVMTMMTFQAETPSECGIVELDTQGVVRSFHEKVAFPPGNLANAAVYILESEVLAVIDSFHPPMSDVSTQLLPALVGRINTWQNHDILIDVGTPERLVKARQVMKDRSA